jgi:hypothetical protein
MVLLVVPCGTTLPQNPSPLHANPLINAPARFQTKAVTSTDPYIRGMYIQDSSPLINRKSTLNKHNKILIYKQIIRPAIMYGAEIWSTTVKSNIKIVEQLQNTYLRRALEAPLIMRNTQIQRETNTEPIKERIQSM